MLNAIQNASRLVVTEPREDVYAVHVMSAVENASTARQYGSVSGEVASRTNSEFGKEPTFKPPQREWHDTEEGNEHHV